MSHFSYDSSVPDDIIQDLTNLHVISQTFSNQFFGESFISDNDRLCVCSRVYDLVFLDTRTCYRKLGGRRRGGQIINGKVFLFLTHLCLRKRLKVFSLLSSFPPLPSPWLLLIFVPLLLPSILPSTSRTDSFVWFVPALFLAFLSRCCWNQSQTDCSEERKGEQQQHE